MCGITFQNCWILLKSTTSILKLRGPSLDYQLPINGQHNSLSAVIFGVLGVCLDLRIPFSNHFIERTWTAHMLHIHVSHYWSEVSKSRLAWNPRSRLESIPRKFAKSEAFPGLPHHVHILSIMIHRIRIKNSRRQPRTTPQFHRTRSWTWDWKLALTFTQGVLWERHNRVQRGGKTRSDLRDRSTL